MAVQAKTLWKGPRGELDLEEKQAKEIQLKCKTLRIYLAPRQAVVGVRTGPQPAVEYLVGATP